MKMCFQRKARKKSILKHADPKWGAPSLFKASNIRSLLPKVLVTKPPPKNPLKQWQLNGQSGSTALRSVKSSFACLRAPGRHSNRTKMRSEQIGIVRPSVAQPWGSHRVRLLATSPQSQSRWLTYVSLR